MFKLDNSIATVSIGGLGALGMSVARELDDSRGKLDLISIAVRNSDKARERLKGFVRVPRIVSAMELSEADIVVEAAPAAAFREIVEPAVDRGRVVLVASGAALLTHFDLVERAQETGATILVPSGAVAGLDAIRAVCLDQVDRVTLKTRKTPVSLMGAPYIEKRGIDLSAMTKPVCVFNGSARDAAAGFPANANVAAAVALAGIGPERTQVEIWADPGVDRNIHEVRVVGRIACLTLTVEAVPSPENPRTSRLAPMSVIACLRRLHGSLRVGS